MQVRKTVLGYSLAAGAWFIVFDVGVPLLLSDPAQRALANTLKDCAFVVLTVWLLNGLLRRLIGHHAQSVSAEKAASFEKERSLRLLQAISEGTTDAVFAKGLDGRYLLFNRAAARMVGLSASQVLGRDDAAIFPPEQAAMLRGHDKHVLAQDQAQTFDEQLDTIDGRHAFMATKGPLHDAQGNVVGMFGISRDITDRLRNESLLRSSEQRYRLLFDANPQPMWVFDRETLRFLAVNDAALLHYGYTREEFLAMTISDIRPIEDIARLSHWLALQHEGLQYAGIWRHRSKDGRLTEAEISSNELNFDGRPARLVLAHDVTERLDLERQGQVARDAALDASAMLNDVLSRVDDGLVGLDQEWRYTYLNQRAAKMLGREKPSDLLGRHIWAEFPEGIGKPFHRAYQEAMRTQQPVVFEDYYEPWDLWFENRVYPDPNGLSIYFTDVTVRKRAERALTVSELQFRLAAAGGQVWDWKVAVKATRFPPEFWNQLGRDAPEDAESVDCLIALMHPDDLLIWRQTLRDHLVRHAPYQLEFRARHADGDWRWFYTQGQAVWDSANRASYMAGTTFDITERKRAEAALRDSEAYRRSLFDQLGDGVLLLDDELRLLDANLQAIEMLGYERDELLRLNAFDLLPAFEHHRVVDDVSQVLAGEPHLAEWDFVRKDGSLFSVEASAHVLDEHRFVAVIRDITLRKASQAALVTYQLELSALAQQLMIQEKSTTQKLAQVLHDRLGQTLAAARLNLEASLSTFGATFSVDLMSQFGRVMMLLEQAIGEVREALTELRPPLLDDQGLAGALRNEIGTRAIPGAEVEVRLEISEKAAERWPLDVEYSAFMIAREAIANARLHARASLIRVVLSADSSSLRLEVVDDGCGIPEPLIQGRAGHLGIVGMRERALAVGARFDVGRIPGGGTCVTLHWESSMDTPRGALFKNTPQEL